MKATKILQMPIRNAKGGITQYALNNWANIDKTRFRFDWVTLDARLDFEDELVAEGCVVHHLSCRQEDDESKFMAEMRAIFAHGYDVVHLHTSFWRGFLAEELAIEAGIKRIIVHAHSSGIDNPDETERAKLFKAHNEWKSRFHTGLATHFAACSSVAGDFLFGMQIPNDKIILLPNAVDTDKFAFKPHVRREMRDAMGLDGKFVILMPARLEFQKNHRFALDFFVKLLARVPNAILLLAGEGKLRCDIEAQISNLGIGDNVHMLGFRNDIDRLLQAADVMIAPSLFEGFAMSMIESYCSGCCCYCYCVPKEATLLSNIFRLNLIEEDWVRALADIAKVGYERVDRSAEVAAAGFSLKRQIGELEKIYLEK